MLFWRKNAPTPAKTLELPWFLAILNHVIAETAAKNEVEHDFLKARVPSGILKWISQPSNFTRLLNT